MDDVKIVDENAIINSLYQRKKEGVQQMRTSLLACTEDNNISVKYAIQNVTAMRVYHQLTRIVQYLELMDKLEQKLYESIDSAIENTEGSDPAAWLQLLAIQEKLQKNMIESHKMLQPYLDIQEFTAVDLARPETDTPVSSIMSPESRDRLRSSAQAVLIELKAN